MLLDVAATSAVKHVDPSLASGHFSLGVFPIAVLNPRVSLGSQALLNVVRCFVELGLPLTQGRVIDVALPSRRAGDGERRRRPLDQRRVEAVALVRERRNESYH